MTTHLSPDRFKYPCPTCSGSGRVPQFTKLDPTMHQVYPPKRGAKMVTCEVCEGTGKARDTKSR